MLSVLSLRAAWSSKVARQKVEGSVKVLSSLARCRLRREGAADVALDPMVSLQLLFS
jgi:hypothetical protein